jgi:hypothetical protein
MNSFSRLAIRPLLLFCAVLAGATGCERSYRSADYASAPAEARAAAPDSTLAIEHDVAVELDDDDIGKAHQAVLDACKVDTENPCTVLESTVRHGEVSEASLRMRVGPKAVEPLVKLAAGLGEVAHRTTRAEDLAKPILDTDKRLAMLEAYLEDLLRLRQQSRQEVDALIRVAAEIAKTQSELDAAKAEQAQLRQRVDLQILAIRFYSEQLGSFGATIGEAMSEFGMNLGSGIAQAIVGLAFLLPWLVILIPLLFLLRRLWRKYR